MKIFKKNGLHFSLIFFVCLYAVMFLAVVYFFGFYSSKELDKYTQDCRISTFVFYTKEAVSLIDSEISLNNQEEVFTNFSKEDLIYYDDDYTSVEGDFYIYDMNEAIYPDDVIKGDYIIKRNIVQSEEKHGYFTLFNAEYYIFYCDSNLYDYSLFLVLPKEQVITNIQNTTNKILIYGLISAGIILSIYLLFKRQIYNPIRNIEKTLEGIFDGDVDSHIQINRSNELFQTANILNKLVDRIKHLTDVEYTTRILKKQAELNALQSQINPHFLYNTLDSIRGLALREGATNVSFMTKALSNLFRYSISSTNSMVMLEEELNNIDNYLIIQQFRFKNKFKFTKDIDDSDANIFKYQIPKLALQIVVENAIYHGLEKKIGDGVIKLSIISTEKRLIISVKDNGVGIDKDKLKALNASLEITTEEIIKTSTTSSGIALINLNQRIKLFFGLEYGIKVYSEKNVGTTIEILLPLMEGGNKEPQR